MSADTAPNSATLTTDSPISDVIALEQIGASRYRGRSQDGPRTRIYGGEVAGQAVLAAGLTAPEGRFAHSAHMQFLRPGDSTIPVEFEVEITRDGGSFSTRRVEAWQHGQVIFTMTASYQGHEEGLSHQVAEPDMPAPETLPTPQEMFADDPANLQWFEWLSTGAHLELRFAEIPARAAAARGDQVAPRQRVWLRSTQSTSTTELDRAAELAYISDILLLSVALGPHRLTLQGGELQFATVDHTIWFHEPLDTSEWFLYQQESRWAGSSRALCHGEIFDRSGKLCATTMQEGLLRLRDGSAR